MPAVIFSWIGVAVLAALSLARPARAATITFSDSTFNPSDWSLTTHTTNNGGTASASQLAIGGHPGAYRQIQIAVNSGTNSAVFAFSLMTAAMVNPAQGPISLLTYGLDHNSAGAGQEFGPALLQNGTLYYSFSGAGATTGFQTFSSATLTSSDFNAPGSSTTHPDFTSAGSPITFGFVAINNTGTNGIAFNTTGAYDNWTLSVTTVPLPEPASLSCLLVGGLLLKRRCRSAPNNPLNDQKSD